MGKVYDKLENIVRKYIGKPLVVAGLVGILSYGGNSYAQEFKVNPEIGDYSTNPRIAMNKEGNFIITYRSQRGYLSNIYAQRFDKYGNRIGEEFRTGEGVHLSIAMDKEGNFITTWEWGEIVAQRYDKEGKEIGEKFQVSTLTGYYQVSPEIAMNDEGRFVICWKQFIFDDDPRNAFYAQIFDEHGNRVGHNSFVGQYLGGLENPGDIAMRDNGDFVTVWDSKPEDPSIKRNYVLAQRYDRNGNELGERIIANKLSSGVYPNIIMNDEGDFVITWYSGRDTGIFAHKFDSEGNRIGNETMVNSYIGGVQGGVHDVAMNNSKDFIVTWESWGQDGDDGGIYAQRFGKDGNKIGGEFQVNTYTENAQHQPQVAMNNNGDIVAAWTTERFEDYVHIADVYAKIFPFYNPADLDKDGYVDFKDFAIFTNNWLAYYP